MNKRIPSDDLPYDVDAVDIVAELPELIVSEITLAPGQEVPWHLHSRVNDVFYGLSGCTAIRIGNREKSRLKPGESITVPARTPHQVECDGDEACRFLIVQGIGEYDFVPTRGPSGQQEH